MSETDAADLSSLLRQLNAYCSGGAVVRPPSPSEAMAIYSVAVRLVGLQLTVIDGGQAEPDDVATTRAVLLGTRQLLRTALDRLEDVPRSAPQLVLIPGGA